MKDILSGSLLCSQDPQLHACTIKAASLTGNAFLTSQQPTLWPQIIVTSSGKEKDHWSISLILYLHICAKDDLLQPYIYRKCCTFLLLASRYDVFYEYGRVSLHLKIMLFFSSPSNFLFCETNHSNVLNDAACSVHVLSF